MNVAPILGFFIFMLKLPVFIGIYTITNIVNNKMYIGYAKNLRTREKTHMSNLRYNKHPNSHLQDSVNKYGIENFLFEVLEYCAEEYLCALEHYWCNILDTHNREKGYNIEPTHPSCECKRSKETVDKTRVRNIGKKLTKEHIEFLKNRPITEEFRQFCREKQLGSKQSEETIEKRKKTINALPKEIKEEYIKRKVETRKKNAEKRGYFYTKEQIKNRVDSRKNNGYTHSQETIYKINNSKKGRKYPKMSECKKGKPSNKSKIVFQYSLQNKFIKEFPSCVEADFILNNKRNGKLIASVARGVKQTAYGFKWSYRKIEIE